MTSARPSLYLGRIGSTSSCLQECSCPLRLLPTSPAAFAKAAWDDIAPYFDDLVERPLDASTVEEWLQAWSRLEELVTEAAAQAMIAYTIDTSDREKEEDHLRFSTEILPKMEERSVELARRLVALGYATPGARHHAGPVPDLDRDLPRGEHPASSPSWRS